MRLTSHFPSLLSAVGVAVSAVALGVPLASAQQLPWLVQPAPAPQAVPQPAPPPVAAPAPQYVAPPTARVPSPVMPVPNAPLSGAPVSSAPVPPAPVQSAPVQHAPPPTSGVTSVARTLPGSNVVPDVQAMAPAAGTTQSITPPAPVAPAVPAMPAPREVQTVPVAQPGPLARVVPAAPIAPAAPIVPGAPVWLNAHIGDGEGQISATVLKRAREYHQKKVRAGAVKNPCYFAFDATRPAGEASRFYVICESDGTFRAVSSGHGAGRNFQGVADLSNKARCAKNFSNARNSHLTTGGGYVTAEVRTSFKGYYRGAEGYQPLMRSFLQFEGEGDTATARARAIGGHSAAIVRWMCRMKIPNSPHADKDGYVPYGKLVDYSEGRSSGCTSWPQSINDTIMSIAKNRPTTVYIYPEAKDIVAVGRALRAGQSPSRAGLYWSASCLKEIGEPNFWPREKLEPALIRYQKKNSSGRPRTLSDLPICKPS